MIDRLEPLSSAIGFSNEDTAVLLVFAVLCLVLAATGSKRAYSAFYG